jgi:hypothetical protein
MSTYVSVHSNLQSDLDLSRRSAERYAQLEAVRQSRERQREVRSRSLFARLVHAFA